MYSPIIKASFVIDYAGDNKIFDVSDSDINRDNCAYFFYLLKLYLDHVGVNLSTYDINTVSDSSIVVYVDVPKNLSLLNPEANNYLIVLESDIIKRNNFSIKAHEIFNKVFTWHDGIVDNKKYFKINFSHKFPDDRLTYSSRLKSFSDKKFCTLVAGNKKASHPHELYSQREKTIRWFEKNACSDFDLYGIGWDKLTSSNRYVRYLLSKVPALASFLSPNYASYKGSVNSKLKILSNYKFSICYENGQMIPGYITEKIFDCFFAGCVPVYWGAPNVADYIPKNCFIDRRNFNTHQEMYDFLKNMSESEYVEMQANIENYLFSQQADPYRAETFANTIVDIIVEDLEIE